MKLHLLKASALALIGAAVVVRAHEDPAQAALHDVAKGAARVAVDAGLPPSGAPPPGQGPPRPSESCVRYSKVKCCLMECEDRDDKARCDDYCERHYGETSEDASEPSAREIEDVAAGAATGNDDLDWCLEDCEYDSLDAFDENLCKAQCRRDFDNGNDRRRDWDRSPNNSPSRRGDGCDDDDLDCCLDECYYNSRSTTDENLCQARCVRDFDGGSDSRRRPDYSPNRSPSSPSNRSPTYRRPSSPNRSPSSPNRRPSPNRSPSSPNRRPSPYRSPSSPNRSPNARPAPSSHMDEAAVE